MFLRGHFFQKRLSRGPLNKFSIFSWKHQWSSCKLQPCNWGKFQNSHKQPLLKIHVICYLWSFFKTSKTVGLFNIYPVKYIFLSNAEDLNKEVVSIWVSIFGKIKGYIPPKALSWKFCRVFRTETFQNTLSGKKKSGKSG